MITKFWKQLNFIHLFIFVILYFISCFLIVKIPFQQLPLVQVEPTQMFNSYLFYDAFKDIPQSRLENIRLIISKILGISLNTDWYDLCLTNDTRPPTKIGKIILPIGRNVTLAEIDAWKNRISSTQTMPENSINRIVSNRLIANPTNVPTCTRLSPIDSGFLYSGLIYFEGDKPTSMSTEQELKIIQMIDGKNLDLGNSNFELKINKVALSIKRFALFFALSGLYLLILSMWSLVYKSSKKL